MNWKSRRNHRKSRKAKSIYAIVCYGDWCVREYKFAGKWVWDKFREEYIPLVYHYDDHNGEYETCLPTKITYTTTGKMVGWTFNKDRANALAYERKILEKVNYGKAFND